MLSLFELLTAVPGLVNHCSSAPHSCLESHTCMKRAQPGQRTMPTIETDMLRTLQVVTLSCYVAMNIGLAALFICVAGSIPAALHALVNISVALFLLSLTRVHFGTTFIFGLWAGSVSWFATFKETKSYLFPLYRYMYVFAARLTICEPLFGADKWFVACPCLF